MLYFRDRVELGTRISHVVYEPLQDARVKKKTLERVLTTRFEQHGAESRYLYLSLAWDALKGQDDCGYYTVVYQVYILADEDRREEEGAWRLVNESEKCEAVVIASAGLGFVRKSVEVRIRAVAVLANKEKSAKAYYDEASYSFEVPAALTGIKNEMVVHDRKKSSRPKTAKARKRERVLAKAYQTPQSKCQFRSVKGTKTKEKSELSKLLLEADASVMRQWKEALGKNSLEPTELEWHPNTVCSDVIIENDKVIRVDLEKLDKQYSERVFQVNSKKASSLFKQVVQDEQQEKPTKTTPSPQKPSPPPKKNTKREENDASQRYRLKGKDFAWDSQRRVSVAIGSPREVMRPKSLRNGFQIPKQKVRNAGFEKGKDKEMDDSSSPRKSAHKLKRKQTFYRKAELAEIGRMSAIAAHEQYTKSLVQEQEGAFETSELTACLVKDTPVSRSERKLRICRTPYSFNRPGVAGWLVHEFGHLGTASFSKNAQLNPSTQKRNATILQAFRRENNNKARKTRATRMKFFEQQSGAAESSGSGNVVLIATPTHFNKV